MPLHVLAGVLCCALVDAWWGILDTATDNWNIRLRVCYPEGLLYRLFSGRGTNHIFNIRLKQSPSPPRDHVSDTDRQVGGQELWVSHTKEEECICLCLFSQSVCLCIWCGDRLCENPDYVYTFTSKAATLWQSSDMGQNEGLERVIRATHYLQVKLISNTHT